MAGLASCTKADEPISENSLKLGIIGKWKYAIYDGKDITTNEQMVCTYHVDGTAESSYCSTDMWYPKYLLNYTVIGNTIVVESKEYGAYSKETISHVTKDRLKISHFESPYNGTEDDTPYEYVSVANDFSKSILGLWKGESMDGQQTFGDENHIWEYNDDGTFSYYSKESNGKWLPMDQDNQYVCDGDLLATRWKADGTINVEKWNVETCDSKNMAWKAERKAVDGSTYSTNFSFKRISDNDGSIMSTRYIQSQISGMWKGISRDGKTLATNDRGNYTFYSNGTGSYTTITLDIWNNDIKFNYSLTRNFVNILYADASITKGKKMKVTSIDADSLCVVSSVDFGGSVSPFPSDSSFTQTYSRVSKDYHLMVIGLWEGVSMTGEDYYDVTQHRWKFNSDNSYYFYAKKGDKWERQDDMISDYMVTGDMITTHWREGTNPDINYERWDIDSCDADTMVWSAIREREDGSQYSVKITFKRIQ